MLEGGKKPPSEDRKDSENCAESVRVDSLKGSSAVQT